MDYPIKYTLVMKLSKELNIPESVIDAVIAHEMESAKVAMNDANSIELSGFGRFYFNEKRARKKLQKCLEIKGHYERIIQEMDDPGKRTSYQLRLQILMAQITLIKTKLKE